MNTKSRIALTLTALAGLAVSHAQAQRFQAVYGTQRDETVYDIEETFDGGYVTAGSRTGIFDPAGADPSDYYIVKHRKDGTIEWAHQFGGPGTDIAYSIHQTHDGGYIVAGQTDSTGPVFGLGLVRLDPAGFPIWSHAYTSDVFGEIKNPAGDGVPAQVAVRQSELTGDFLVVSNITTTAGGQLGMYLRTDPGGGLIVHRAYMDAFDGPLTRMGFSDIKELPGGDILISGFYSDDGDTGVTDVDALALRTGPFGGILWSNRYEDFEPFTPEVSYGHDLGPNGDIAVLGVAVGSLPAGMPVDTDHRWIRTATGALIDARRVRDFHPSFSATRVDNELRVITAGDRRFAAAGFGPAAAMMHDAAFAMILLGEYGPLTMTPDRAEAVAWTPLSCGFILGGIKSLGVGGGGIGGLDQHLVKANDAGESGCLELLLPPQDFRPELRFQQVLLEPVPFFEQIPWGFFEPIDSRERFLCFDDDCDPACPADLTGSSDPNDPTYGIPDGDADGDDFFFYLDAFSNGVLAICDITGSSDPNDPTYGSPDGDCDGDDFFVYLDLFAAGCP